MAKNDQKSHLMPHLRILEHFILTISLYTKQFLVNMFLYKFTIYNIQIYNLHLHKCHNIKHSKNGIIQQLKI